MRIVRGVPPAPVERPASPPHAAAAAAEPGRLVHRPDVQPLAAAALLRALPCSVEWLQVRRSRPQRFSYGIASRLRLDLWMSAWARARS